MEGFARFIVKYRIFFTVLFIVLSVAGAFCSLRVNQNYDISKYLPSDSDTSKGLAIMQDEFGLSNIVLVMVEVDEDDIFGIKNSLGSIDGVQLVTVDSYNGENALFSITLKGDEYSQQSQSALAQIKSVLNGKSYVISGSAQSNAYLKEALKTEIPIIMAIAVAVIMVVLFITSHSWVEPLVLGIVLLSSVLINMGSNIIFGEISYITFAVSAILQLALSLDYSIILLHSYNQFKANGQSKEDALVNALARNMRPISSSGLTTIAGLIALFFMSFTIGFDIGIVLAKGILASLLCVMFFMPSLILLFSKALTKTEYKPLLLGGESVARVSIGAKNVLPIILVAVIAVACVLQTGNVYTFGGWDASDGSEQIAQTFGNVNQAVLIVDGEYAEDKKAQSDFVQAVTSLKTDSGKSAIKSVATWATMELTLDDVSENISMDKLKPYIEAILGQNPTVGDVVSLWQNAGGDVYNIQIPQKLIAMALGVPETDRMVSIAYGLLKEDGVVTVGSAISKFEAISSNALIGGAISSRLPEEMRQIITYLNENRSEVSVAASQIISPIIQDLASRYGEDYSIYQIQLIPEEAFTKACNVLFNSDSIKVYELYNMWTKAGGNLADFVITERMIASAIGVPMPQVIISAILSLISSDGQITVGEIIEFLHNNRDSVILNEALGSSTVNACSMLYTYQDYYLPQVNQAVTELLTTLKTSFVGDGHGRIIITMDLPKSSEQTFAVLDDIKAHANTSFGEQNFLAGESMTLKDISDAFEFDLLIINFVTIGSIFVIIALLFRSLLLPIILVLIIQGAIWITMAVQAVCAIPIFFMSYIICICIQMGATIDYGILIASNYRRNRENMLKKEAIIQAVKSAMPTVVTSGSILVAAGLIVGFVSTVMPIYSIGRLLGLGAVISILLILLLLPAVLYVFDKPISALTWDGVREKNGPKDKTPSSIKARK